LGPLAFAHPAPARSEPTHRAPGPAIEIALRQIDFVIGFAR
jgi:hypothetical protein